MLLGRPHHLGQHRIAQDHHQRGARVNQNKVEPRRRGAPDRTIIGLIVQQALILGASGLAIGLALILLVKDNFPRRVVLEPFNALVLAGIILVVCLVASGLGVRAAIKVDPATALGG